MARLRSALLAALALTTCACAARVGDPGDPGGGSPDGGNPPASPDAAGGAPSDPDAAVVASGPDAAPASSPGDGVVFLDYPEQHGESNPGWGGALTDIARHLPLDYGDSYRDDDPITFGHETTHGIQAHLRNNYNDTGERANAFYVMADRAALVVEPDLRKSDVTAYIPASLRGYRFDLYITGQVEWDDTPLYLFDEWVAYTNGAEVGVDLAAAGAWDRPWQDGVSGPLEFTAYALAVGMAVEELDPDYFAANTQFREFLAWNARRAMALYRTGAVMDEFAWDEQDAFYQSLRTSPDAEELRGFARRTYGEAWAAEVLGL